ncbi:MAG: lactate utilization protein [Clostridium sp.]
MDKNTRWFKDNVLERTKESLNFKGYEVYIVEDKNEAREMVVSLIQNKSTVACGGSQTLEQCGILDALREGDYDFLDRYSEGLTKDDIKQLHKNAFLSDYYLTSSNAITQNGELVNLDGLGNRVAAMIYGPERVIILAGENKITADIDSAYERVRKYVAPTNCKRLEKGTPCLRTASCINCSNENRICNHYVVTYRQNSPGRAIVILVKEDLGY